MGGEMLEDVAYWRDLEEDFDGKTVQDLNEKLYYAAVVISVRL